MVKKISLILLIISLILIFPSCKPASVLEKETTIEVFMTYSGEEYPKPTGYINDYLDMVDTSYEDKILSEIKKVKEETNAEILVVTIESLEGKSIDDYTLELYNTWHVSRYGIILLLSLEGKGLRITTGYDMEKVITNDIAKSIIDDVIMPELRKGNIEEGMYQGVKKISEYILTYGPYTSSSS